MVKAAIYVIGAIASVFGLITFLSGYENVGQILAAAQNTPATVKRHVPKPALSADRKALSSFVPLAWMPRRPDGSQRIYAQQPAGFLRSAKLVSLDCDVKQQCKVLEILALKKWLLGVDSLAIAPDGSLVALDRNGHGVLIRAHDERAVYFGYGLPCVLDTAYSGGAAAAGGFNSIHDIRFDGETLHMRLQARKCRGKVKMGYVVKDVGMDFYTLLLDQTYFQLLSDIRFDQLGNVQNSQFLLDRVELMSGGAPTWFSYNSGRGGEAWSTRVDKPAARDQIVAVLNRHASARLYVGPDIPAIMRFNAYIFGKLTSDSLVAVMDLSINQDAREALVFTTGGVIAVRGGVPSPLMPYRDAGIEVSRGLFGGLKFKNFFVETNGVDPDYLLGVIRDVAA